MDDRSLALHQLQALLGADINDDALWRDIRRFEMAALPVINTVWGLADLNYQDMWSIQHAHNEAARTLRQQRLAEALCALEATPADDTLERCAAAFLLHPQLWQPFYSHESTNQHNYRASVQARLLPELAAVYIGRHTPTDWSARIGHRILMLCAAARLVGTPNLADCVGYLLAHNEPASAPLLDALTAGAWEAAWRSAATLAELEPPPDTSTQQGTPPILDHWSQLAMADRLRTLWQESGAQHAIALLWRLYRLERLDAAAFRRLLEVLPSSLRIVNNMLMAHAQGTHHAPGATAGDGPTGQPAANQGHRGFIAELQRLADIVLWEMLCDFRPEAWPALSQIRFLSGGRYLLRLAEEAEHHRIVRFSGRAYANERLDALLMHLLGVLHRRADDDSAQLVALLRQLSSATLLAILPHVRPYENDICEAIGWDGSAQLVALLHRLQNDNPARSTNPNSGVVQREEILLVVAPMEESHVQTLLDAFADQQLAAVTLARAALGWNRKELRRLFGRRNQLAARALPLLPMEQPGELLHRYLLLTKYQRETGGSRAGRKAYEHAAAQAGLSNLALHAGYADATRLEWAMEDQIGAQVTTLGQQWQIEDYTLTLVLRAGRPVLDVRNSKRTLKRTPALVTREYAYREVRAALEQAEAQQKRYRQAFLDTMRRGQPLSSDELALLSRNPLAAELLERLVLVDEAGACGLFRSDDGSLEGCYGERVRISGAVSIAHSYTLMQMGLLADWQAELVRRQIVQPFRQVFRELYTITPAELQDGYASGRLAGRRLKSRQALAVLANLGWQISAYGTVHKPFYDLGYAAHFETGDYGYDEDAAGTSGALTFWPLDQRSRADAGERRIRLADVPPLIFSEVLRDLDMVTVIAHESEERGTSREVLQQRGDLVRATTAALGLTQVQVEEPLVYVRGALTNYRIHLATGAIYLESGQYLCIVPSVKERKAIYLPFEEGGEPLISEIISKILLLSPDTQINDATILAQITPQRQLA